MAALDKRKNTYLKNRGWRVLRFFRMLDSQGCGVLFAADTVGDEAMLDSKTRSLIRDAFKSGGLQVRSVQGDTVEWSSVADVLQHHTTHKRAYKVSCGVLKVVATEDHSLFLWLNGELVETCTSSLSVGDPLAVVFEGCVVSSPITSIEEADPLSVSYDLSVPGPENFILSNGIVAHNSYSIGGVSLDIEKSGKYQSAYDSKKQSWDEQLERAKATVKIVKGLQQPKFGVGIRSAFGPYTGKGVLTPRKFVGF